MPVITKIAAGAIKTFNRAIPVQVIKKDSSPLFDAKVKRNLSFRLAQQYPHKLDLFKRLFNGSHKKVVRNANEFLQKESELFYQETKAAYEIHDFETNKTILSKFLSYSPEELALTKKEYKEFITLLQEKGLQNEINIKDFGSEKFQKIFKELSYRCYSYEDAVNIYFRQNGLLNPDISAIKLQITPYKIKLNNLPYKGRVKRGSLDCDYTRKELGNLLEESKNLTLESGSLMPKSYNYDAIYDLPLKFASASYNSLAKNGNAYINSSIPKLFEGINEKELFESFDLLSTHLRTECHHFPKGSVINLKIGGKDFACEAIGHGSEGVVYRIAKAGEKPVILKLYNEIGFKANGLSFASYGLYGNLGILREANLAGVVDVPTLHMANPIYKPITGGRNSKYVGAWQIVEDATTRKEIGNGLEFELWLEQKGLEWHDRKSDAIINGIYVDNGGIINSSKRQSLFGDDEINRIYKRYLNGETTDDIIDFLNRADNYTKEQIRNIKIGYYGRDLVNEMERISGMFQK